MTFISLSKRQILGVFAIVCTLLICMYFSRKFSILEYFKDKQEEIKPFEDYDTLPRPFVALYDDQGKKLNIVLYLNMLL